jgi:hypothetical protein
MHHDEAGCAMVPEATTKPLIFVIRNNFDLQMILEMIDVVVALRNMVFDLH